MRGKMNPHWFEVPSSVGFHFHSISKRSNILLDMAYYKTRNTGTWKDGTRNTRGTTKQRRNNGATLK